MKRFAAAGIDRDRPEFGHGVGRRGRAEAAANTRAAREANRRTPQICRGVRPVGKLEKAGNLSRCACAPRQVFSSFVTHGQTDPVDVGRAVRGGSRGADAEVQRVGLLRPAAGPVRHRREQGALRDACPGGPDHPQGTRGNPCGAGRHPFGDRGRQVPLG